MNHFNEGNKFYTEKQFQKAINSYRLSIDSNVNVPCSYYNIGVCYIKLRDFDSAIKMIKKSLEFQKESEKIIKELYMYDVLRADRCISSCSMEARVPFADLKFDII